MGVWNGPVIMIISLVMIGGVSAALESSNWNEGSVQNGPQYPVTFTFEKPFHLLSVETYHWNDGQGVAEVGSILLTDLAGKEYGPWQAVGSDGSGGAPNAIWTSTPDESFPAGTYTVYDSDPDTWSQNAESGYTGFTLLRYEYLEEKVDPVPSDLYTPIEKTPPDTGTKPSGLKVIDSTFTSGIDENNQPVDRKKAYLTSDDRVYFWVKSGPYDGGEKVEMVWFDPTGTEFYHSESFVADPNEYGYDFWIDNYQYTYLFIAGKKAEKLPGTWRVDVYIDGEYVLSDECMITPDQSSSPESQGEVTPADMKPVDVSVLTDCAFVLNANSQYDVALKVCDRALQYSPDDPATYSMRGWALSGLGRYDEALADLDTSLRMNPDNVITLQNKAYCLINLDRCDEVSGIVNHLNSLTNTDYIHNYYDYLTGLCGSTS